MDTILIYEEEAFTAPPSFLLLLYFTPPIIGQERKEINMCAV